MRRPLIASVVLSLVFAAGAQAQTVRGRVTDQAGNRPIAGARLYLLPDSGPSVDSTRAASDGRYELHATTPGNYRVHFQMDGWATYSSELLAVEDTVAFDFEVPLVSNAALHEMSAIVAGDERLQTSLPELCGEELRTTEAGLLIGVVRDRRTRSPIAGARVSVGERVTQSNERGVYILCNVPLGPDVEVTVERDDARSVTPVEIRRGMVSWYDLTV